MTQLQYLRIMIQRGEIKAEPGEYIICDVMGRYLRTVDYLTSGLGLIFQIQHDGSINRVIF